MTSPMTTINPGGDHEETVLRYAKHLGKDKHRRAAFRLIYGRGSKPRSKKQIAEALGVEGEAQVIQNALEYLAKHHLIKRLANDGYVKDGSRVVYAKEEFPRAHRAEIERYADDPAAAKKVATKRQPNIQGGLSFVRPVKQTATSSRPPASREKKARLRIALLVTNPVRDEPLQTLVEARDIRLALRSVKHRDAIHVETVPAPTFDILLDTLNEYRPTVLHFSGHGGGRSLLFDNKAIGNDGGTVLDFDMIARVIAATSARPDLLVLVACDTVDGADRFLSEVPAVIAMAASVDDDAAGEFARRFYQSLGGGATIKQSLTQAKLFLEQEGFRDADLPTLIVRDEAAGNRTLV